MRLKSLISTFRISSRKFYEIVKEKQERIFPATPEEALISKYLKSQQTVQQANLQQSIKPKQSSATPIKTVNYQQIIQKNPHGSIIKRAYKDIDLNLISLNFQNIELREIYKICEKYSPDIILLQARPEHYLKNFSLVVKKNGTFSDRLYFEQLVAAGPQLKQIVGDNVGSKLSKIAQDQNLTSDNSTQNDKIFIKDNMGIVDDSVSLMASHYAVNNKKSVLFSDLPEQPWREWICNSHTLMQIQQIFKHITKNIPFYQSLKLSPQQLGCILKPQIFLNLRDRYTATLIQMLVATNKYKKVLQLTGIMQNEAVIHILDNQLLIRQNEQTKSQEFTPILEYLIGPPIKSSIIRNISGWQIIQKHIIFDVLHHGEQIMSLPLEQFVTTNKVIRYYGVELNSYEEKNILKFRFDKTLEYVKLMQTQIKEGRELKKKFMLREAIRANYEDDQ